MKTGIFFSSVFASFSLFVLPTYRASAAYVVVDPADFGSFSLDIDNDGESDISNISANAGPSGLVVVNIASDFPEECQLPGGFSYPGGSVASFTGNFGSLADLMNADIYSGVAVLTRSAQNPTSGSTAYTDIVGYISTSISEPVIATWLWGTKGRGPTSADPVLHHLVGWVVDASAYALDASQPITIYYNNYGPFPEGHSAMVSFSATGVPEPSGLVLPGLMIPLLLRRRRQTR